MLRIFMLALSFLLLHGCGTLAVKDSAPVERVATDDPAALQRLADRYLRQGDIVGLTRTLTRLWHQSRPAGRANIEYLLWQQWQRLPAAQLETLARRYRKDAVLGAWIALALADGMPATERAVRLKALRKRYPDAIYHAHLLPDMLDALAPRTGAARIAVFLPLTGRYAVIGQVIRKGIVKAALTRYPDTHLFFMDTGPGQLAQRYEEAVAKGAEWIIGPLRPEAIRTLSTLSDLPLLALNNAPIEQGYLFPFVTADEGRQIGERLHREGRRFIGIFVAPGKRTERIASQINEYWRSQPGHAAELIRFSGKQRDLRKALDTLLHVAESKARARYLRKLLGRELHYTPRARQDLDTLVLAVSPGIAAVVNPLLDFYNLRIPLIGTSQFMPKRFDRNPRLSPDLAGLRFPAFNGLRHPRLVSAPLEAFGWDALLLAKGLPADGMTRNDGMTGVLIRHGNRIDRRLVWFKVGANGRIVPDTDTVPSSGERHETLTNAADRPDTQL